MTSRLLAVAVLLAAAGLGRADDWPQFRGPQGNGISAEKSAPTEWSATKNVKWKAALPEIGSSSPIVSNGRVFVNCVEDVDGKKRSLYCFDRKEGKKLWTQTVGYGIGRDKDTAYEGLTHCSSTPASDGKIVVVWHASAGLVAYDFDGKELWKRDLGEFRHEWAYGSSPIIHEGKVYLNCGPGKRVFFTCINLADGKTVWETDEPQKFSKDDISHNENDKWTGSWTTPVVAKVGGQTQILCAMASRVVAYDAASGKIAWWCNGISTMNGDTVAYSSLVISGDICVVVGGFTGASFGVRLGGSGDVTATHQVWLKKKNVQIIGTGVAVGDHIYLPFEGPVVCLDPKSGEQVWKGRGSYWGSATYVGGNIYVTDSRKGSSTTTVFKATPEKFEVIAKNELGEDSHSTPAVSDGQIFIRTFKTLWCIGP